MLLAAAHTKSSARASGRWSDEEAAIISRLEQLSEENDYRSLSTDSLIGYPDHGSGAPAGRYDEEPLNLIQFATEDAFPMVSVSRYANVFYTDYEDGAAYSFDWNG